MAPAVRSEAWRQVVEINLSGVFICCRETVPYLRKARHGRIVNLSSIGGKVWSKVNTDPQAAG